MKVTIDVKENVNEFKDGDVLVYDFKTKKFETKNIKEMVDTVLKPFEIEKQKIMNEMSSAKERYNFMLERVDNILGGLEAVLRGVK